MIKYSITIKNQTDDQGRVIAGGNAETTTANPGSTLDQSTVDNAFSNGSLTSALVSLKTIEPYINQVANLSVSQISFQNGSTELQQRSQVFAGFVSSAVSLGLVAIGNPAGAAKMAGMQILQKSISFYSNWVNIQNAKELERENLALRRSRAGMLAGRSRGTS